MAVAIKGTTSEYLTWDKDAGTLKLDADADLPAAKSNETVTVTLTGTDGKTVDVDIKVTVPASKVKALRSATQAVMDAMGADFDFGDFDVETDITSASKVTLTATLKEAAEEAAYFANGKAYDFSAVTWYSDITKDGSADACIAV